MSGSKKMINELVFQDDIFYYQEHTWAKLRNNQVLVGITDYAQDQLGEMIFIELPSVDDEFQAGDIFGQAESAKTVSSLYMPISGKVTTTNSDAEDNPELVNRAPYEAGWMIIVEPKDLNELKQMLSKEDYIKLLEEKHN